MLNQDHGSNVGLAVVQTAQYAVNINPLYNYELCLTWTQACFLYTVKILDKTSVNILNVLCIEGILVINHARFLLLAWLSVWICVALRVSVLTKQGFMYWFCMYVNLDNVLQ